LTRNKFKKYRIVDNYTIKEIADKLNISPAQYRRYELNLSRTVPTKIFKELAKLYNVREYQLKEN